jgi:hypothetical protein
MTYTLGEKIFFVCAKFCFLVKFRKINTVYMRTIHLVLVLLTGVLLLEQVLEKPEATWTSCRPCVSWPSTAGCSTTG